MYSASYSYHVLIVLIIYLASYPYHVLSVLITYLASFPYHVLSVLIIYPVSFSYHVHVVALIIIYPTSYSLSTYLLYSETTTIRLLFHVRLASSYHLRAEGGMGGRGAAVVGRQLEPACCRSGVTRGVTVSMSAFLACHQC